MATSSTVDIPSTLLSRVSEFRMSKRSSGSAAITISIDKKKLCMGIEEEHDSVTLEDLEEELPENTPRFIVLSYQLSHRDGRVSFPLVLIYWAPTTASMEMSTLYTSALTNLSNRIDIGKVVDMRDGTLDRKLLEQKLGA